MVSMVMSFCAVLFPQSVLDEILNLIESVSENFPSYSCIGDQCLIFFLTRDIKHGYLLSVISFFLPFYVA